MKIIVTGGRDYKDREKVFKVLNYLNPDFVRVGDCPTGVDAFVEEWLDDSGRFPMYRCYVAKWDAHGKAAGPLRNIEMIQDNLDSIVIAFPGGKGTLNCMTEAKKRGLIVLKVE